MDILIPDYRRIDYTLQKRTQKSAIRSYSRYPLLEPPNGPPLINSLDDLDLNLEAIKKTIIFNTDISPISHGDLLKILSEISVLTYPKRDGP
jgi:hypothetical protein